jgi:phosphoribosylformimino-5-aminoimidazole carboxamide ribotide isomerase
VRALDLAKRASRTPASRPSSTDIDRDGALGGVNVEATATLADAVTTPVIASGGVASLDDLALRRPRRRHRRRDLGRALYDGRDRSGRALRCGGLRRAC